jgi:hypothetical protein
VVGPILATLSPPPSKGKGKGKGKDHPTMPAVTILLAREPRHGASGAATS